MLRTVNQMARLSLSESFRSIFPPNDWIRMAMLCLTDQVRHFSRGHVVIEEPWIADGKLLERLMKLAHRLSEEHRSARFLSAVCVEFDEAPVFPAHHGDARFKPQLQALNRRGSNWPEIPRFQPGNNSPFPGVPVGSERALNHQESVLRVALAHGRQRPSIMRLGPLGVI